MEEENKTIETTQEETQETTNQEIEKVLELSKSNQDLKNQLNDLQTKYNNDKKNYFNKVLEGGSYEKEESSFDEKKFKSLIDDISNKKLTNLDFWDQTLQLADEVRKKDPTTNIFNLNGNPDDEEKAQNVERAMREFVKESNGDPDTFKILYNKYVNDANPRAKAPNVDITKK